MKQTIFCVLMFIFLYSSVLATNFYVSPRVSSGGSGTIIDPWNLQTALNHPLVGAGDTIWLAGGRYIGVFTSTVSGRAGEPVVIRSLDYQEAILDGNVDKSSIAVLSIEGQYSWFWGLTITNSDKTGDNYFKDGVYFVGENSKLINSRIYNNGGNGVGFWQPALNSEIYGCIIYHNGYRGDTRGHGHGIYSQNTIGSKLIRDNILFNSFGIGIHIYAQNGGVQGFELEGNTIFNSGIPGADYIDRNILIGGFQQADRIFIKDNHFYNRPDFYSKASVQLGYAVANRDAEFYRNIIVDGSLYMVGGWDNLKISENTFFSGSNDFQLLAFDDYGNIGMSSFDRNNYYKGSLNEMTFEQWKSFSGQDINSEYFDAEPVESSYYLLPNIYQAGRTTVVVYNWAGNSEISVDLSTILKIGNNYQIWDVLNYEGGPVADGVYQGNDVYLPLDLSEIEIPIREDSNRDALLHTLPFFGVFIISSKDVFSHEDSAVIEKDAKPLEIQRCYPNPVNDILVSDFYSSCSTELIANVYDAIGRLVYKKSVQADKGDNAMELNLSSLLAGVYIVALTNGVVTDRCKIIKHSFASNEFESEFIINKSYTSTK